MAKSRKTDTCFHEIRSSSRFPLELEVSVRGEHGDYAATTQNISASGVLLTTDWELRVGSTVEFIILLPAGAMGAFGDVEMDCRGRVMRSAQENGHYAAGVIIDEYRLHPCQVPSVSWSSAHAGRA